MGCTQVWGGHGRLLTCSVFRVPGAAASMIQVLGLALQFQKLKKNERLGKVNHRIRELQSGFCWKGQQHPSGSNP